MSILKRKSRNIVNTRSCTRKCKKNAKHWKNLFRRRKILRLNQKKLIETFRYNRNYCSTPLSPIKGISLSESSNTVSKKKIRTNYNTKNNVQNKNVSFQLDCDSRNGNNTQNLSFLNKNKSKSDSFISRHNEQQNLQSLQESKNFSFQSEKKIVKQEMEKKKKKYCAIKYNLLAPTAASSSRNEVLREYSSNQRKR